MNQRQGVEVHPEKAGNEVQWQEDGSKHRERAHDVIGATALYAEMHLHGSFGTLLEAAHVVHHTFDMFEHIAAAHLQQVAVALLCGDAGIGPGFDGLDPVLHRGTLVFTDLIEVVQRQARFEQRGPIVEARLRVEQFALPVIQLVRELPAQLQKPVDHQVDDAQHHVGWTGRQTHTSNTVVGMGGLQ